VPAAPVQLNYSVAETELALADRKRIEAAAKDPVLLGVLEALKAKRGQLQSVAECVQQLELGTRSNLFTSIQSGSAVYRWQAPNRYYADISQPMLSCEAFRIGCDGQRWWFHAACGGSLRLQACPLAEMHEVNALFCDPFELQPRDPAAAARERHLNYLGRTNLNGTEHHVIESWHAENFAGMTTWGELTQWWIDSQTALPTQVVHFRDGGISRERFLYDTVNQPLPEADFALPSIEGLSPQTPDALDADYTKRYVTVRDGSDGRMSGRWGKQGPKGTSSGGLN